MSNALVTMQADIETMSRYLELTTSDSFTYLDLHPTHLVYIAVTKYYIPIHNAHEIDILPIR